MTKVVCKSVIPQAGIGFPFYTERLEFPELTGEAYHVFGSFPFAGQPNRPEILTVISGNTYTRIVARAEWINNDWPEVSNYEGRVYGVDRSLEVYVVTYIVNKLALRLRFGEHS